MLHKLKLIMWDFGAQMKKLNISALAASTAFFLFLSLVPMLIIICMVLPYTPLTEQNLVTAVTGVTPGTVSGLAEGLIADVYEESTGFLSVAIIAMIWSASKGMLALMRGLNAIYDVEEKRNYVVVRLIASIYTVLMLVAMLISLLLMVFGNKLVALILYHLPRLEGVRTFGGRFRFLSSWVVLTLLFAAIYTYVPNMKMKFREQLNGAGFAAAAWNIFSWGFSIYVEQTNTFTIYGSLSIIVIVMIWMYFCMYIILIGAYLNRYFRPVNVVLWKRRRK
ncbi:MAG: YihY/virulence factor BrkB family protein [Lachnospiraceae bacterium]|nr:YihY/virulence factor BrkB family protein [Lachnospiraceae bacterium]